MRHSDNRRPEAPRVKRPQWHVYHRAVLLFAVVLVASVVRADAPWTGTYVLLQQSATLTKIPVVSNVVALTRAVSIQHLAQKGKRIQGRGYLCALSVETNSKLVKTRFPEAFVRALPGPRIDAVLHRRGDELTFSQAPQTLVIGAKLARPTQDALPDDAKDRRVVDQDSDGHPGMTVHIDGIVSGQVYVVQRNTSRLTGQREGNGFSGTIQFKSEQEILGASSTFLEHNPRSIPLPEKSHFRLQKVPEGTTCSEALRLAETFR